LNLGSATPRDLVALRRSLDQVPNIREALASADSSLLQVLNDAADELADVRALIGNAIEDDPPPKVIDGGVIRASYSTELDELRSLSRDAKQTIAAMEQEERARTGIGTLRIALTTCSATSSKCRRRTRRACPTITNAGKP